MTLVMQSKKYVFLCDQTINMSKLQIFWFLLSSILEKYSFKLLIGKGRGLILALLRRGSSLIEFILDMTRQKLFFLNIHFFYHIHHWICLHIVGCGGASADHWNK